MLVVHVGPRDDGSILGQLLGLAHGRASLLFALVAGVGVALLTRHVDRHPLRPRLALAWRSALLLPAGLYLQTLDVAVYVILADYAVLFAIAIPLCGLRDRTLLLLAAASATVGSLGYLVGLIRAPDVFTRPMLELGDPLPDLAHGLLLSGPYPKITWLAPFLLGIWIGHRDLASPGVRAHLLAWGAAAALGGEAASWAVRAALGVGEDPTGWALAASAEAHSQMPLWLVTSMGSAAFVLGASLLLADAFPRAAWPLVATGQLALTVYVAHLVVFHVWPQALDADTPVQNVIVVGRLLLVTAVGTTAWRAVLPRGPLELLLHLPTGLTRPRP